MQHITTVSRPGNTIALLSGRESANGGGIMALNERVIDALHEKLELLKAIRFAEDFVSNLPLDTRANGTHANAVVLRLREVLKKYDK